MAQNRASMVITEDDERNVIGWIGQIEATLKGLTALEIAERRRLRRMGLSDEAFAREALAFMEQHRQIVPPSLDIAEMRADLDAFDRMRRINAALQRLATMCADTEAALGSDALVAARNSYKLMKVFGPAHGLLDAVKALGARFMGQGKKKSKDEGGSAP